MLNSDSYTGNVNLRKGKTSGSRVNIIIGTSVGAAVLVIVTIVSCVLLRKGKKKYYDQGVSLKVLVVYMSFFFFFSCLNVLTLY